MILIHNQSYTMYKIAAHHNFLLSGNKPNSLSLVFVYNSHAWIYFFSIKFGINNDSVDREQPPIANKKVSPALSRWFTSAGVQWKVFH